MLLLFICAVEAAYGADDGPITEMTIHASRDQIIRLVRGEYALMFGDIMAARRYLVGPAEAGNVQAARRMASSYDPVWLVRNGVDPWESFANEDEAIRWYRIAAQAGDTSPDNRYVNATR